MEFAGLLERTQRPTGARETPGPRDPGRSALEPRRAGAGAPGRPPRAGLPADTEHAANRVKRCVRP